MAGTRKIKRAALTLFVAVSAVLLWVIIDNVGGLLQITTEWNMASVILTVIGALITLAPLTIALVTLHSIRAEESPFSMKNVKRLRAMAILLIAYEPFFFIKRMVFEKLYPLILPDGTTIKARSTIEGVVLAAGLVVYCVSLVFEYGITLQRQFDETL